MKKLVNVLSAIGLFMGRLLLGFIVTLVISIIYVSDFYDFCCDEISGENRRRRTEEKLKKRYSLTQKMVRLQTELPFTGTEHEVIYMEDDYDEATNRFIRENIELIKECFAKRDLRFVYLPLLGQDLESNDDVWKYFRPYEKERHDEHVASLPSNFLLDFMYEPANRKKLNKPSLARLHSYDTLPLRNDDGKLEQQDCCFYEYFLFDVNEAKEARDYIEFLSWRLATEPKTNIETGIFDSRRKPVFEDADEAFDMETQKLLKYVEIKIDQLRRRGVSDVVLEKLVKPKPVLSRIVVSRDYRIRLPDYGDMEIKMEPLAKSVFLLFLRHHEGIRFKDLPDYREELSNIYKDVKGRKPESGNNMDGYSKSVINVTDPLNNSINEKCTRVKEAFLLNFHETMAENYFITGKRGEPKRIRLPKELIVWEE